MDELKGLSLRELRKLSAQVTTEISRRMVTAKRQILAKVEREAKEAGLSLADVIGGNGEAKRATTTVKKAPKAPPPLIYWNPVDARQGWSGRGRKPAWVQTYLDNGGELERLRKK